MLLLSHCIQDILPELRLIVFAMYSSYYTLYWNPYSICSLMVRYTLETRGPPKDGELDWNIENKAINIFAGEQISEHFLCEVNPKGEVSIFNPSIFTQIMIQIS